jgi:ATP-binding cassette, subfamily B, bacterial
MSNFRKIMFLTGSFQSEWLRLLMLLVTLATGSLASVYPIQIVKRVVDAVADQQSVDSIVQLVILYVGIRIVGLLFTVGNRFLNSWIQSNMEKDLRVAALHRIMTTPVSKLARIESTQLVSRVFELVEKVSGGILGVVGWVGRSLFTILWIFVFLFQMDRTAALVMIPAIALMVAFTGVSSGVRKRYARRESETNAAVKDLALDLASGLRDIAAFNAHGWAMRRYEASEHAQRIAKLKSGFLSGMMAWILSVIGIIVNAAILYIGAVNVGSATSMGAGEITAFMLYGGTLFGLIMDMCSQYGMFQGISVAVERYIEVVEDTDEQLTIQSPESMLVLDDTSTVLAMERVSFAYDDGDTVLYDMSLEVRIGEAVAVVGPSGSGKTTLLRLLLGLATPTTGRVTLGGVSLSSISPTIRSTSIAPVFQQTYLFNTTVRENVVLGRDVAGNQLADIVALADAHGFIGALDLGLDTNVGEQGARFSGGQVQRIGLARAFAGEPSFLVLDEVSSALDGISEQKIIRSLRERTSAGRIIVSHRPSMIRWVDRIIVIDEGRVIAEGRHADLASDCILYQKLMETEEDAGDHTSETTEDGSIPTANRS